MEWPLLKKRKHLEYAGAIYHVTNRGDRHEPKRKEILGLPKLRGGT